MVATSHSVLGSTGKKTGVWLSELTHPYYAMEDKTVSIDIVSIQGGQIPIDPGSLNEKDEQNRQFLNTPELKRVLENSRALNTVDVSQYDALIFAGGHGTVWDFSDNQVVANKIRQVYADKGIVGAICHGVAAFLFGQARSIIDGKNVTGFSNKEEEIVGLSDVVPYLLEDRLKAAGGIYSATSPWGSHVVIDGNIITAQNPQSAHEFGQKVRGLLVASRN
ncbi:MAG: type 1 glutamine amidotransferase domain-containing protein [Francisellaceae bacterium]